MFSHERPGGSLRPPRRASLLPLLAALGVLPFAACEDDPFGLDWMESPDTVVLYSLARPEGNLPSAFNFYLGSGIRVEAPTATGNWDVALDTRDDRLVLLPPGALNINSRARVTSLPGMEFDDVREAPRDTAVYTATEPVPIEPGTVYVIRTTQRLNPFGRRCVHFAKLQPLDIDVAGGTLRFVYDTNPNCSDLRLVPPDD